MQTSTSDIPNLSLNPPPGSTSAAAELKRESEKAEQDIISASLAPSFSHSTSSSNEQAAAGASSQPMLSGTTQVVASPATFAPPNPISLHPDGIGGMGLGTAATGDLGAQAEFETLDDMRKVVKELEDDFNAKHPEMPLSGRIIHVSHYIPFVLPFLVRKGPAALRWDAELAAAEGNKETFGHYLDQVNEAIRFVQPAPAFVLGFDEFDEQHPERLIDRFMSVRDSLLVR